MGSGRYQRCRVKSFVLSFEHKEATCLILFPTTQTAYPALRQPTAPRWRRWRKPEPAAAPTSEAKAPARKPESDSVNLNNVKERIDAQPDFDRAKVDSIKAALQEGNYPVNPRRIAENFVSLEKLIQG